MKHNHSKNHSGQNIMSKKVIFISLFWLSACTIFAQTPDTAKQLKTVEVAAKQANGVSTLATRNVERISRNELKKAPCCNLSESFETNGTVDVTYSDAITGAKEIQLLGLRGPYTQLLIENRPDLYGLATPFAGDFIPGTWIESIEINKGVGSVKNGSESIAGQINTELVKPGKGPLLFANVYAENTGRVEANVHINKVVSENFSTGLLLHGSIFENKIDRDADYFVDIPLKKELNAMYRTFYEKNNWQIQTHIQALVDHRESGQLLGNIENPYTVDIQNRRVTLFSKISYTGFDKPYNALGSQFSATYHDLNSLIGQNNYSGVQRSVFGNILYATIIGTTDHKITYGASGHADDYPTYLNGQNLSHKEATLGAYAEYTYSRPLLGKNYSDWTIIAGLRTDELFGHGFFVVPRLNVKYNFNEGDIARLAIGRGVRVASPLAENINLLTTNRQIVFADDLKPEDAWTMSANFVKTINFSRNRKVVFGLDLYRTQFTNQIVTDIESSVDQAQFYNLSGQSFSNVAMASATAEIFKGFEVKVVYKYTDVQSTYDGKLLEVPLVSKHRVLTNLAYQTPDKKWSFSATWQYVGSQRLADRYLVPHRYQHHYEPYSPNYSLVNASVNHTIGKLEIYGGADNIFGFVQHLPIIAYDTPTSIYFDATQVYAPMFGTKIYAGLRWRL